MPALGRKSGSPDEDALTLARRMKAIREPPIRRAALARVLLRRPPEAMCDIIRALIERAQGARAPEAATTLDALTILLEDDVLIPYETRAALYASAKQAGAEEVARLFLSASPATLTEREEQKALAPERAVVPRGRVLTLGERKALARSHRRDMLLHMLRDPHPDVVRIILGNRHVTERDIMVIASRRPSPPESLAAVAAHERWGVRHPVKRALVLNPHTPVHLALRLATTLRPADLRAVEADQNLPAPLREQAAGLMQTARSATPRP